jgi:hypothetical protein
MRIAEKRLWLVIWLLAATPSGFAQTRVALPKNDFPVAEDVRLGREVADEVTKEKQFIRDEEVVAYVQAMGARLLAAVPPEFQNPAFQFQFQVLNDLELNAFALPGGPMFINRGVLEQAQNESELASVMAHEISHVVLRHATAERTKRKEAQPDAVLAALSDNTICGLLGPLCGVLVQSSQLSALSYLQLQSREHETQADLLGLQIMSRAGYAPAGAAAFMRTLKRAEGRSGQALPWLKSHPDLNGRIARLEREAGFYPAGGAPAGDTRFAAVRAKLQKFPRRAGAETAARRDEPEPEPAAPEKRPGPPASAPNNGRVALPAARYRLVNAAGGAVRLALPENWQPRGGNNSMYAPDGAYDAQSGISHGVLIDTYHKSNADVKTLFSEYLTSVAQNNGYLSPQGELQTRDVQGRTMAVLTLAGVSPATRRTEVATLYVTLLNRDTLLSVITVAPEAEREAYAPVFRNIINSLRFAGS